MERAAGSAEASTATGAVTGAQSESDKERGDDSLGGFQFPGLEDESVQSGGRMERPAARTGPSADELFTLDYAFRDAGGREGAIALAGLISGTDQRLKGVVDDFHATAPNKRFSTPRLLETLALDNDLDPAEFLGLCVMAMYRYQFDAARVTASLHFEQIVDASVQRALSPNSGYRDTKLLMEHMRFLPEKGALVNLQVNQQGGVSQLPDFKNLAEIALQASRKALPEPVEGELIEDDQES